MSMGTVVIVDDEVELGQALAELLELEGYEVKRYSRPEDALGFSGHAKVVISDIAMPVMTGPEMMRNWALQKGPQGTPPVIFMTGHIDTEKPSIPGVRVKALLYKPVELRQLDALIKSSEMS